MSQWIQVKVSDDLAERIREVAEDKRNSFDAVAEAMLRQGSHAPELLIETSDEVMATYSDDELWAVVDQQLTKTERKRLDSLLEKNRAGKLSPVEEVVLDGLIAKTDFQTLERSKAFLVLQQRGHDIQSYVKTGKR